MKLTKKQLLENLDERYSFYKDDCGYILFDINKKGKFMPKPYVGYINIEKGHYIYRDAKFDNVEDLANAIDKYNETLPFSSELYFPRYKKNVFIEMACQEYLKSLGMTKKKSGDYETYSYKNPLTGEILFELSISVDDNTESGKVIKFLGKYQWEEFKFENLEEAIGAINSSLICQTILTASSAMNIINKMTNSRLNNGTFQKVNLDAFKLEKLDMKESLIKALEKELENLKNS